MNEFLRTRQQIDNATKWLKDNGYTPHGISAKDWELKTVLENIGDGNLLDMGSDGSYVLENAVKKGIQGRKVGVDLAYKFDRTILDGVELFKGDLMQTGLPDNEFDTVCSLSVLEHAVDYHLFAREVTRLLKKGGQLYVSFDYAEKKIDTSLTKLYSLDWNILSKEDAELFIDICFKHGLILSSEVDWTVQDMVINPRYCSPANCEYTFGFFHFIKE